MSFQISEQAVAAREQARNDDGTFGRHPAVEAPPDILGRTHFASGAPSGYDGPPRGAELVMIDRGQMLTLDQKTGASAPLFRDYSWHDEDGNFTVWSEDLGNTPAQELSPEARVDLALIHAGLENGHDAETIMETLGAESDDDGELRDSLNRLVEADRAEREGAGTSLAAEELMHERRVHEADGGFIEVDRHTGEVSWRTAGSDYDQSPLYRAAHEPEGRPAVFDADGTPRVWVRGSQPVRSVLVGGGEITYHSNGTVASEKADGEQRFYDERGLPHREDGPAVVDDEQQSWLVHGSMHRDPDEGPSRLMWTGEVAYHVDDTRVDPTPEQMERHGVEVFGTQPFDEWSGVLDRPGDTMLRYRMIGSDPDAALTAPEETRRFDYSGTPVDPGHWPQG